MLNPAAGSENPRLGGWPRRLCGMLNTPSDTLLAGIGAFGKESINLPTVTDMTRLDPDRRHPPRLFRAKLTHQKAYRLRVVDSEVRRYA